MSTGVATGYSVAIHPDRPLDLLVDKPDVSVGVYSIFANRLLINRGAFKPQWMDPLGKARAAEFVSDQHVVAVRQSGKYAYAAFAAIPTSRVDEGLRHTALLRVPFGVLGGVVLALAVLYLARQQLAMPAVLKAALKPVGVPVR